MSREPAATVMKRPPWWRVMVGSTLGVLLMSFGVMAWGTQQGYLPPLTGYVCAADAIYPVPSFQTLVRDYDMSPICARDLRGETWF